MNSPLRHERPPFLRMIVRGLFRRCAWCGGKGAFFTSWYGKADRCRTCGLGWQRNYEGFELGAATMGVFITFGSIIAWMIVAVVLSVPLVPLLVVAAFLAVAWPILWYPNTYTVWFGVDLFIRKPSEEDLAEAEAHSSFRGS
ncbi:MAG: hypothetical protein ACO36A_06645 [Ilumatobacteraceae bacterium]